MEHLGVQGVATRAVLRDADLKWIYLGCILPDIPWILQRFVQVALPSFDAYDLHLYVIVQGKRLSSFVFCSALRLQCFLPTFGGLLQSLESIHFYTYFSTPFRQNGPMVCTFWPPSIGN